MLFTRFRSNPGSALVVPRAQAGTSNWPKCTRCKRAVDAYGIENETDRYVEIWARCDGIYRDPRSGQAVHGHGRKHESMKSSVRIGKGPGWSNQRFTDIVSRMAFFAPDGDRDFRQTLTHEGVGKRW